MSNYDHYDVAMKIIKELKKQGHDLYAGALHDAIISGSTGTEIGMRLRYELRKMKESKISIDTNTRNKVDELILEINKALGDAAND